MFIWGPIPAGSSIESVTYVNLSESGAGVDGIVAAMTAAAIGIGDDGSGADSLIVRLFKAISDVGFGIEAHTTEAVDEYGSITIPDGMNQLVIEAWGKGGTGGINFGGGAGGGAYGKRTIYVEPGQKYYGYDAGTSESPSIVYRQVGGSPDPGGDDEQIMLVPSGEDVTGLSGAAGGDSGGCVDCDVAYSGGDGAAGNGSDTGGGGGSSAGTSSNGNNASGPNGGTAPTGGGAGGDENENGATPGGGAGGAFGSSAAGGGDEQFRFSGTKKTGGIVIAILAGKSVDDIGSGTDDTLVAAEIPASDSGSGVDQDAVSADVPVSDIGSGIDSLSEIIASILQSDSGVGADAIGNIQAILLLADVGSGGDVIGITGNVNEVNLSDLGLGDDVVSIHAAIVIGDAGVGAYIHVGGAWVGCHVYVKVGGSWVPTS
jgi:hypothetical protein